MNFGFYLDDHVVQFDNFIIRPLPNFKQTKELSFNKLEVNGKWIYPPVESRQQEQGKASSRFPFKYRNTIIRHTWYGLTSTHSIEVTSGSAEERHVEFLVLAYGFLSARYLLPEGSRFFSKITYDDGVLHPLICSKDDREVGMKAINKFYLSLNDNLKKRLRAALHWFLISESYELDWDHFDAQYKVLDCLYCISKGLGLVTKVRHGLRAEVMAKYYSIILPAWAISDSDGTSQLGKTRNELTHEALFAGEPIGYAYPEVNYRMEFPNFNLKLICGLIGLHTPYLSADPDDRMMWAWDLSLGEGVG